MNTVHDVWRNVAKAGPDECWPWQAALKDTGYGVLSIDGRNVRAHRAAYESATGETPGRLLVLHRCDNRRCCNPAHLWLGTYLDNNRDAKAKGRNQVGSRHYAAKLNEAQVVEIRRRRLAGERGTDLARRFGVTPQSISDIMSGRAWKAAA